MNQPIPIRSSLGRLADTSYHCDFRCPHCNSEYALEWDTEYGEPIDGNYLIPCSSKTCQEKEFTVTIETTTTYTTAK